MTPNEILQELLADIRESESCAAVFDLDSTLFCVSPRSQAILRELATQSWFKSRFPDASLALEKISVNANEYGIKAALLRCGVQPEPELVNIVRKYWRERFFSNSHMQHDLIYPGAEQFVTKVHEAGADVYYLTGRSEALMREGTFTNLKTWKFPDLPESRVMMKPSDLDSDENFKESRLRQLEHRYTKIWIFENEPVIIHQIRSRLPNIRVVYMDSAHSGQAPPPTDLLTLKMSFEIK